MDRQQIAKKNTPSLASTPKTQKTRQTPSYGSLYGVIQRATAKPETLSRDEWRHLDSTIGTRATNEIKSGRQTSYVPKFKGISSQLGAVSTELTYSPVNARVSEVPIQAKEAETANKTGLPDRLKTGIEDLSGYSMDDVKVHYNSAQPAKIQAHAYAQGRDIHIAPGQEQHLPHEAWHVVQQKQGRVSPTWRLNQSVQVNEDRALEKEATLMGKNAMERGGSEYNGEYGREEKRESSGHAELKRGEGHEITGLTQRLGIEHPSGYSVKFEEYGNPVPVLGKKELQGVSARNVFKGGDLNFGPQGTGAKSTKWKTLYDELAKAHGGPNTWKRGHLRNARFGGKGDEARNITPLTARGNSQHKEYDDAIGRLIEAGGGGAVIYSDVTTTNWEQMGVFYLPKKLECEGEVLEQGSLDLSKTKVSDDIKTIEEGVKVDNINDKEATTIRNYVSSNSDVVKMKGAGGKKGGTKPNAKLGGKPY